eukprot:s813_g8.t1
MGSMRDGSRSPRQLSWGLLKKDLSPELHPGCKVRLKALHVQRNGQLGVVEDYVPQRQRWRVRLLSSGKSHDFKAENLQLEEAADRPPPADWVGPKQLETAAPVQAAFKDEEVKPEVAKPPPKVLEVGSLVILQGLKSAPELNEQKGEIEAWDIGSFWSGAMKDLKAENLRLVDLQESQVLSELDAFEADLDHFSVSPGDLCGPSNRFEEALGEGTFSTVFRCRDASSPSDSPVPRYAVKFTRSTETTRRALEREDPEGMRCILCLAFFETFLHQGRLAATFELMKCNLRTALAKYGAGKGLPLLPTVRDFARQLLLALRLLRRAQLIHCDVKPENLLLAPDSRRSQGVGLWKEYGFAVDMWSAAATIFELATDQVLFKGETNNEMLLEMMKVCGPFPLALVLTGQFSLKHFGANGDFLNAKGDVAINSANPRVRPLESFAPPLRPLQVLLQEICSMVQNLSDFLSRGLQADAAQRPTPEVALTHKAVSESHLR